jgi:hypothetical protein
MSFFWFFHLAIEAAAEFGPNIICLGLSYLWLSRKRACCQFLDLGP